MSKLTVFEQGSAPSNPPTGQRTLYSDASGWKDVGSTGAPVALSNSPSASLLEMQTGTEVGLREMSPSGVKAAVDALAPSSSRTGAHMAVAGDLDILMGLGSEDVRCPITLITLTARRGTPGTSGLTTIQLELNGAAVAGAVLSWSGSDGVWALKTVTISQAVVAGDRMSFRITSVELGNPADIIVDAHA